jgi:hypothetical protein
MGADANGRACPVRGATDLARSLYEGLVVEGLVVEGLVVEGLVVEGLVVGLVVEGLVVEGLVDVPENRKRIG